MSTLEKLWKFRIELDFNGKRWYFGTDTPPHLLVADIQKYMIFDVWLSEENPSPNLNQLVEERFKRYGFSNYPCAYRNDIDYFPPFQPEPIKPQPILKSRTVYISDRDEYQGQLKPIITQGGLGTPLGMTIEIPSHVTLHKCWHEQGCGYLKYPVPIMWHEAVIKGYHNCTYCTNRKNNSHSNEMNWGIIFVLWILLIIIIPIMVWGASK